MSVLEDLQPNAAVRGILPDALVAKVTIQWVGSEALELTYKNADSRLVNRLLHRQSEAELKIVELRRPWSFHGDSALFRVVSEAHRIRLAQLIDPVLADHSSLVNPLTHQINHGLRVDIAAPASPARRRPRPRQDDHGRAGQEVVQEKLTFADHSWDGP